MGRLFRHSAWDSLLLAVTLSQLLLNGWLACTWKSWDLTQLSLFYLVAIFLFWYNALIATHNFVHTPWFTARWLNQGLAILNSANLGFPVTHYRYIHFNHHQYGNDRQDASGRTQDWSSIFAYGKRDQPEPVLAYCALAIFRDDVPASFHQAKRQQELIPLSLELAASCLAAIAFLLISWQFFLLFFLPVFYIGWFLTYLSNYYEHYGATPENRYADSTSYYGRWFNRLFCNEGYHQEHHLRPNIHWTKRPQLYHLFRQQLDSTDRVILKVPHLFGFLQHRGKTQTPARQHQLELQETKR